MFRTAREHLAVSHDEPGRYRAGQIALLATVEAVEPVVGRALTETIAMRWPEAPPYGGQFIEVITHLTVAHSQHPKVFDEVEAALACQLPAPRRSRS
jgi:ABC-type molybdate transport system substrate-binding protein